jgi:hypothetical protein
MSLTHYRFRTAVCAFSRMPTEHAAALLPPNLRPLEVTHGAGVFAAVAIDFTGSEVGAYQELVLAVIVPPNPVAEGQYPKAAFYPVVLATSTAASRAHASERWHLPHYADDVDISLQEEGDKTAVYVYGSGEPIVDLAVTRRKWNPVEQLYQSFMVDAGRAFKVDIHMKGLLSVHEEERGMLRLHDHAMVRGIQRDEIEPVPFRELWMRDGSQAFEELQLLETS